jgi:RNA polymerase sigma-70 factor, ECF subfamily
MNVFSFIVTDMADSVAFAPEHREFVFAVVRKFLHSAADADDVTQEALLLAYRHRDQFRGDSRYRTWLYRIAVTTALGYIRKHRRSRITGFDAATHHLLEGMVDPAKSPETLIADAEHRAQIERALVELQPTYREVLLARVDATEPEIAARFGISVGNVKIRTHRARKQLRVAMDRIEAVAA